MPILLIEEADLGAAASNGSFVRVAALSPERGESPVPAHSVEKLTFANAEIAVPNPARAPLLSGFAPLLRRRKDLSQFPEVLGGCGEQEFIVCAAWTT